MDKNRITLALSANANGSERLPILFIGHAARPHCFKGNTGAELGFDYKSNKKARMTCQFFRQLLRQLDKTMRAEGRILLLLDNVSSHSTGDLQLANVAVKKLPSTTTAWLQPVDGGAIALFKRRYRTRQIEHTIERIDSGETFTAIKPTRWTC